MGYFNEDQEIILDSVKEFCETVLAPRVATDLEQDVFPMDVLESMRELGYPNCTISEQWGGLGESMVLHSAIEVEVAKTNLSMALIGCSNPIATLVEQIGTQEQKEAFMPGLVAGQGGLGFTEPCAGSDSAGIQTTAVKDGDEWVINGQKTFISFLGIFDWYLISARTNETDQGGISAFLVHKDTPGLKIGSLFDKLGMHGSNTGELFLEDVRVPQLNMIGKENHGLRGVLSVLDEARMGTASAAVGIAEAALEKAVVYAKERIAFGKPISSFQGISWYFAEMAAKISAARALLFEVSRDFDEGKNVAAGAAKAKWFAAQVAVEVTDRAVQICGGMGIVEDYGVARLYRDARVIPIIEGTDEVLKIVVARDVLR
ncbi:acyl-CoA dehydrogenase family protein [Arabiibacter massiliensis]|uniref:acyl-CoA dehydrogenase family protein n=1 Tax=Arabiibacter massiliensis TaxID=1870985 RepID=UPI0009BB8908|nr:acyl-CoA dehydrogenase family protein [Arabiibacter massiliensis]